MSDDPRAPASPTRVRHRVARGAPSYRAVRSPLVSMGPSLLEEQRRHRTWRRAGLIGLVTFTLVAGLVWVVVLLGRDVASPADGAVKAAQPPTPPIGRPEPLALAYVPAEGVEKPLRIQLPVRRLGITAIGFSRRNGRDLLPLAPEGSRANPAFLQRILGRFLATEQPSGLRWYELSDGGQHNSVTVGAAVGTDVYAPLAGTVIAISDNVVSGERHGVVVQIQPLGDGETLVTLRGIDADPALAVGNTVSEGITLLGHVRELPDGAQSSLGRYSHDSGTGVELAVRRVSGLPLSPS